MKEDNTQSLNEVKKARLDKLAQLEAMGVNPFSYKFTRTHQAQDIFAHFEEFEEKEVTIAGRIMSLRRMGKAAFAHIMDNSGRAHIHVRGDQVGEQSYDIFKLVDIGDIVGVSGKVFKTRAGEITVIADKIELLTKNIRPLPIVKEREEDGKIVQYDAFSDTELRYRQRYVDLVVNREI